jgi:hypothetical protein
MNRRSHTRAEKIIKELNEQFLADVLSKANGIATGRQWVAYLNLIMKSSLANLVKSVYKVAVTFKQGLKKFMLEDLTTPCHPKGSLFEMAYKSFEDIENKLKLTPRAKISEYDKWLVPHLMDELTSVLKMMDEMIWNTTSKTSFVAEQQNRILRARGDAFVKHPLYEEFVQWAFNPIHLETNWFADHGFLDEDGLLE